MRATTILFHPQITNLAVIGFEDGSIRTVHIEDHSSQLQFTTLQTRRPQFSWFENASIRSILPHPVEYFQFIVCDEVIFLILYYTQRGNMFLWNSQQVAGYQCSGISIDVIEKAFSPAVLAMSSKSSKSSDKSTDILTFTVGGGHAIRSVSIKDREWTNKKVL